MNGFEENEKNSKTSYIGLYHFGVSYHEAARALAKMNLRTTHPDSPVSFLYYHSFELFLKAFLRLKGVGVTELEKKYGHSANKLQVKSEELGYVFMDEDRAVFQYMIHTDVVIRSRYIETGYFNRPTVEALERTAASLRETTHSEITKSGTLVRP